MAGQVARGQETGLPPLPELHVRVEGKGRRHGSSAHLDASAFLLTRVGQVLTERHFVFYGNKSAPDSSVRWRSHSPGGETFVLSLARLPDLVDGIVVTGSLYDAAAERVSLSDLGGAVVTVTGPTGDAVLEHQLPPLPPGSTFDAAILAVLLRRNGDWIFRAAGEASDGGLAGLATSFGVVVT